MKSLLSKLSIIGYLMLCLFELVSCTSSDNNTSTTTPVTTQPVTDAVVGTTGVSAITASDPRTCTSLTGTAKLVCLCDQFKASLSATQQATLLQNYTYANIKTWSNVPASMSPRLGLKLGDLTATQVALAKAIVKHMSGTASNEGYDEVQQLLLADDI